MTKPRIAIVEDEPIIAEEIALHLQMLGYDIAGTYHNATEACTGLTASPPALALVDVNLDGAEDGIDLTLKLNGDFPVIFLTSYGDEQTINRAKEASPAGYIIKPFDERDIRSAVAIALHNTKVQALQPAYTSGDIFVRDKGQLVKINCHDILWIEASDNYTYIKTTEKKYLVCSTLKKVSGKICCPFLHRIHRSYLVNMDRIAGISESHVIIKDFKLPIGKTYRKGFMQKLALL
ncbi:MAG: LytTR family transcriptional regulator DNA-binding domain-containing protein [Cyclobacteriaceae bacterium]